MQGQNIFQIRLSVFSQICILPTLLSSREWHSVVWYKLTNVSKKFSFKNADRPSTLKTEAGSFYEMLLKFCQKEECHIPEDGAQNSQLLVPILCSRIFIFVKFVVRQRRCMAQHKQPDLSIGWLFLKKKCVDRVWTLWVHFTCYTQNRRVGWWQLCEKKEGCRTELQPLINLRKTNYPQEDYCS